MASIDKIYTAFPFYGKRRIHHVLNQNSNIIDPINLKKVTRLMRIMGIEAIYPKPHLSKNPNISYKYPYLLRGLKITRPNQVWSSDITYIPVSYGFLYLVAVIDWFSRYVLSYELSNTLDAEFCLAATRRAFENHPAPDIFNTDQGSQFTSDDHIALIESYGSKVSFDGRGRALDNIFIERFWRSLKYEEVYLKDYGNVAAATSGINAYMNFYNTERGHMALNMSTPRQVHFGL